jgi:general secretion pathway protein A
LRQRVLVHYDLQPLNAAEVQLYILHRLSLAGSNGQPQFTPRAIKKIARGSLGIPRMINNLCDKALLASFIRNGTDVNWWDARKALKDINRLHQ